MMAISEINDPESGITGQIKFYQPSLINQPLIIAGEVMNIDIGYYSILLQPIGDPNPRREESIIILNEDTPLLTSVKVTDTTYNVTFTEKCPYITMSHIISGSFQVVVCKFDTPSTTTHQSGTNNQIKIKVSSSSITPIN